MDVPLSVHPAEAVLNYNRRGKWLKQRLPACGKAENTSYLDLHWKALLRPGLHRPRPSEVVALRISLLMVTAVLSGTQTHWK